MDETNIISKILKGIGIATTAIGALAALIVGANAENMAIVVGGIVGSVISGMIFIGFSEVINLLQQNVDNQATIIKSLKEKPTTVIKEVAPTAPVSELQDIETNLPKI